MGGTGMKTKGVGNYMGACAQMCRYSWPSVWNSMERKALKSKNFM